MTAKSLLPQHRFTVYTPLSTHCILGLEQGPRASQENAGTLASSHRSGFIMPGAGQKSFPKG